MASDATEHEMIERLVHCTRMAADRVADVCRAMKNDQPVSPRVVLALSKNLNEAAGCAYQLGHAQANPQFFALRDQLDALAKSVAVASMSISVQGGMVMSRIGTVLNMLWKEGKRMAEGRSVPRADVLAMMGVRQRALVH